MHITHTKEDDSRTPVHLSISPNITSLWNLERITNVIAYGSMNRLDFVNQLGEFKKGHPMNSVSLHL